VAYVFWATLYKAGRFKRNVWNCLTSFVFPPVERRMLHLELKIMYKSNILTARIWFYSCTHSYFKANDMLSRTKPYYIQYVSNRGAANVR